MTEQAIRRALRKKKRPRLLKIAKSLWVALAPFNALLPKQGMSPIGREADLICSARALPLMTRSRHSV